MVGVTWKEPTMARLVAGDGTLVPGLTLPIIELGHNSGSVPVNQRGSDSINGGFVYRGTAIPELIWKIRFRRFGPGFDSSAIFYADRRSERSRMETSAMYSNSNCRLFHHYSSLARRRCRKESSASART